MDERGDERWAVKDRHLRDPGTLCLRGDDQNAESLICLVESEGICPGCYLRLYLVIVAQRAFQR